MKLISVHMYGREPQFFIIDADWSWEEIFEHLFPTFDFKEFEIQTIFDKKTDEPISICANYDPIEMHFEMPHYGILLREEKFKLLNNRIVESSDVNYCPGCGVRSSNLIIDDVICDDHIEYEIYCNKCGWKGYIYPE